MEGLAFIFLTGDGLLDVIGVLLLALVVMSISAFMMEELNAFICSLEGEGFNFLPLSSLL
mgnify:CR=1 FL=1